MILLTYFICLFAIMFSIWIIKAVFRLIFFGIKTSIFALPFIGLYYLFKGTGGNNE